METVLNCLVNQHDWRITLLAVAVCAAGMATAVALLGAARQARAHRAWMFVLGSGLVAGMSIWATHFLAMLGYRPGVDTAYDVGLTLASLAIVVAGLNLAVFFAIRGPSQGRRAVTGLITVAAIAAMHMVGVSALELDGGAVVWEPVTAVVSILIAAAVMSAATLSAGRPGPLRIPISAGLAATSVATLHFGCMAAVTIVPDPLSVIGPTALSGATLIGMLGVGVGIILAVAAFLIGVAYWSRTSVLGQLREAIDAMPDGLAFFDANDRLLVWNARYAQVNPELKSSLNFGASFREIIRVGLDEGLYADALGREEEWLRERLSVRDQGLATMEQRIAGNRWLRVQDRRTAEGGLVTVCTDITDLKNTAQSLVEARDAAEAANRAKSEFLANMSHEIRTPLNGVIGLAQALARTEMTADQREMLDLIQSSGLTLQTLLSDILDLARVESGRLELADEPLDLKRAVSDAVQLYAGPAAEKGLQYFVDIEPEAAIWVRGDIVRLKQILTNLVSNAVKFTTQGFVSINAMRSVNAAGEPILRFTVEDTGIGFDCETRDRLFSRFEQADGTITRKFGGSGLGLAICRQLAEMMQGELDCESEPGGGSAFILTLPLRETEAPTVRVDNDSPQAAAVERPPVRVLLADDHPTNRKVVELILAQAGIELTSVEDGAQALAAYRAAAYDLVLMDMQMPLMDGLTATREIRLYEAALGYDRTPLVMLTANALPDHVAASVAAGADGHLAKPFNAADLLALVSGLGDLSEAERAAA